MRTELLDYRLPRELVAVRPPERRDGGRLCIVEERGVRHCLIRDLRGEIRPGDLVVLNRTKVRKARLTCRRPTVEAKGGARVELLFLHPHEDGTWAALGKANRSLRSGDQLEAHGARFGVLDRAPDGMLRIESDADVEGVLEHAGTMPIPPYMGRSGDAEDVSRYQTVFSEELGSAASPTAGLHLTEEMLYAFQKQGAEIGRITLHVGVGTFRPVATEDLDDHPMHSESIEVDETIVRQVRETRTRGGRVVAIGTTVVRALESAGDDSDHGHVRPTRRLTNLLIQPGYRFAVVDAMLTNFHQPKSTLLALVAAFAGLERTQGAYREAVKERYRFLSYGDAMWIPKAWGKIG